VRLRAPLLATMAVIVPVDAATAHIPFGGGGGFFGGVLHPMLVPSHLLSIVATGLLVGQQMPRRPWLAPASYGIGMAAGFAAIVSAVAIQWTGELVLAAGAVTGALVALASPLPKILVKALGFATGLAVALDSAPQVISVQEGDLILIGTFCGASILMLVVIESAIMLWRDWQRLALRIAGSWIAASATMGLALGLAR